MRAAFADAYKSLEGTTVNPQTPLFAKKCMQSIARACHSSKPTYQRMFEAFPRLSSPLLPGQVSCQPGREGRAVSAGCWLCAVCCWLCVDHGCVLTMADLLSTLSLLQAAALPISMFTPEVNLRIEQAAGSSAAASWDNSMCAITGFSKLSNGLLGVSYVPVGVLPDDHTSHYVHDLVGWERELKARAIFMAMAGVLYDACISSTDTLSQVMGELVEDMDAPTAVGEGLAMAVAATVHCNWLPFSKKEARHLAFGTKVALDALPALKAAVRMRQPAFDIEQGVGILVQV